MTILGIEEVLKLPKFQTNDLRVVNRKELTS